ncbi:MAG: stage V sporulation protein D [Bacilli bacterium]|nr:stage V sporulation protein D [Bacilli bacterium]
MMFVKRINERIKIILLVFLTALVLIVLKIFYVQTFDYKKLSELAEDLWSRDLPLEASRGKIYDRNGIILADNLTTTSLVIIPNQIKNKKKTAHLLAPILNTGYDNMLQHLSKKTSIERVHPEGRRLSYEQADKISNYKLAGVYLVKEAKRYYPHGKMLSHVLGHVGIDNQGLSGLELQYNSYLTGENGAIKYFSDTLGNKLELSDIYVEPTTGMNLNLTIDYNIQKAVERELDNVMSMFEPENALALVMDPNNGEILAMGARPNYDPNNYKKYSLETTSRNLPIWSTYEPGSTFKIITTSAAIEEKKIDLFKDKFYDSGKVRVDSAVIKCWKAGGHGEQTYLQVLQNSCNPGFVKMGQMLGKKKLFSYIDKFGFGEKTGIDLNGEGKGIIFNLNQVGNIELATSAFGQGVSVTPIQQVTAISSVLNDGNLYHPYVLKSISEDASNNIITENKKKLVRKTISKKTSSIMRYALESVVAKGGGKAAYIDGYRIGGKTGTAQKVKDGHYLDNNYIMSFVGIVPANKPKAVLYIAIDNPKHTAMLSSYTTTPIARRILLDIIKILKIPKQKEELTKDLEWNDVPLYKVPNVIGLSVEKATKKLKNFTVKYSGTGKKVISQSPLPGTKQEEKGVVRLMLK